MGKESKVTEIKRFVTNANILKSIEIWIHALEQCGSS